MGSIDEFKTRIGYGARSNLFEVSVTFPFGGDANLFTFLCKSATLPATRTIQPIQIDYQGDQIQIAGDKNGTPDPVPLPQPSWQRR